MTSIVLPVRVDIRTGARLDPTDLDPYEDSVWCEGAADTLDRETREKFKHKIADLREKRKVLAERRPKGEQQYGDE